MTTTRDLSSYVTIRVFLVRLPPLSNKWTRIRKAHTFYFSAVSNFLCFLSFSPWTWATQMLSKHLMFRNSRKYSKLLRKINGLTAREADESEIRYSPRKHIKMSYSHLNFSCSKKDFFILLPSVSTSPESLEACIPVLRLEYIDVPMLS